MRKRQRRLEMMTGLLSVMLSLCMAVNVHAASFDCAKALTKVEKMICADPELSRLDDELSASYKTVLQDEKQADAIRQAQKQWMKERNKCADADCVTHAYGARLQALKTSTSARQSSNFDASAQSKSEPPPKPLYEHYAKMHGIKGAPFNFELTKGQGVPVCEAYLKRLNNTDFGNAPFCGRPEDDSVPGFTRLNRVPLTAEELRELILKVHGFQDSQNQEQWRIQYKDLPNKGIVSLTTIQFDMGLNRLGAWRYNPQVDIDNDGLPDNIIVWYGRGGYACGSIDYKSPYPARSSYTANVLDDQNQYIDEARTRELFEHPKGWFEIKTKRFRYIGMSVGFFVYQGVYYFDTFYDGWGDFEGKRRNSERMAATLAVFLRKNKKTEQVCEYYWTNSDNLYPGRDSK